MISKSFWVAHYTQYDISYFNYSAKCKAIKSNAGRV